MNTLSATDAFSDLRLVTAEEFSHMLQEHQLWLETGGREGKRGNFRSADLTQVDFSDAVLVEASLRGAYLAGVDLSKADLRRADLAEATLDRAVLTGGKYEGANFTRASLQQAQCRNADLRGALFADAWLEGADFSGAILKGVNFRQADLTRANFTRAEMAEANMRAANLNEALCEETNLSEADCRDARCVGAKFIHALLKNTQFKGADLSGVDFSRADFSQALEVAQQYQAQSFLDEQKRLQEESQRVSALKDEVAAQRRELDALSARLDQEKEIISHFIAAQSRQSDVYQRHTGWFKSAAVIWFILTMGFGVLVGQVAAQIHVSKLNVLELAVVTTVALGVLLLIGMTAYRAGEVGAILLQQTEKGEAMLKDLRRSGAPSGAVGPSVQPSQAAFAENAVGGLRRRKQAPHFRKQAV